MRTLSLMAFALLVLAGSDAALADQPTLRTDPHSVVNFGRVPVGSPVVETVTITNVSDQPTFCCLIAVTGNLVSGNFTLVSTTCSGSLAPSEACSATVEFRATPQGLHRGVMEIGFGVASVFVKLTGRAA